MYNSHQEEHPGRERSSVKTILIVEDTAIGSYLVEAIQQETLYHPLLAVDSERALEVVKHIRPNLFILDYRLSCMNGVELYDQLHLTEGLETIPAIILSAGLPQEQLENEIKQRHLVTLPNPHNLDDLLQTIERVFASAVQGTVRDRGEDSDAPSTDADHVQRPEGKRLTPHEELSDDTLIHAIAGRAVWAMDLLYEQYSRIVYSLVYRILADHYVAQDLTQEMFLAVWRHATSYAPQVGTVQSWLLTIAHHRAIDYLRALRRRANLKGTPLEMVEVVDEAVSADVWDEVWQAELCSRVRASLLTIPMEQRKVIELAFFQGWTHSEIAEACNIPLGTVKSHMRRGLLHLKRVLAQMGITALTFSSN